TGFHALSRAALIIDWMLFTMLVVAARMSFVMMRQLFAMLPSRSGPRVVILGAGEEAVALVHAMRDPLSPNRPEVLGILDDDPSKHGRTLNGVPVVGAL